MSRVGKRIITLPAETTVEVKGTLVVVKGKLGEVSREFSPLITIAVADSNITITRADEEKHTKQLHGTTNSLIESMVIGVSQGFKKEIEIKGVGYRANLQGDKVVINAGYSHPVELSILSNTKVEVPKPTIIVVTGISKQAVGQMAAMIRDVRRPNPYSGKGIMYKGEHIRRKEGKSAAK